VNLKGRETEFRNIAIELIKRFQSDVGEVCDIVTCVIVPDTYYCDHETIRAYLV